jgi:hypothetical protein
MELLTQMQRIEDPRTLMLHCIFGKRPPMPVWLAYDFPVNDIVLAQRLAREHSEMLKRKGGA